MSRLPTPGADAGSWGQILNDFLQQAHNTDGTIRDNSISSTMLAPGAVGASGLAASAVSASSLNTAGGTTGQVLTLDSTAPGGFKWSTLSTGSSNPVGPAGGDLAGTYPNPTVPGLATKEPSVTAGTAAQYYRGDKTWQTLDKTTVGLTSVDNTSDLAKPVSTATQTALNSKADSASLAAVATSGAYADLTGKPTLATVATSGSYTDLSNQPTIPAAQVQSDWNAVSGVAQILNKPTIPAAQVSSDWNASSGVAQILNKPTIPSVSDASTTAKGIIQLAGDLGGTAASPTVPGLAGKEPAITAGTTAQYLRGDKTWDIPPVPAATPADHGVIGWTYDPVSAANSYQLATAGMAYVARIYLRKAATVSSVYCYLNGTGGTGLSNAYVALYQNGSLLAQSADQSTTWQSGGQKTAAFSSVAVSALALDIVFWVGAWTTAPTFSRATGSAIVYLNQTGANLRFATADTGLTTTAPATLGTKTALATSFWFAVG